MTKQHYEHEIGEPNMGSNGHRNGETRFDRPLVPRENRSDESGLRLVKAMPVLLAIVVQTVIAIFTLAGMYFKTDANTEAIAEGKATYQRDIAEIRASVSNIQATVNSATAPAAVNSSRIATLEATAAELIREMRHIRDEMARVRPPR